MACPLCGEQGRCSHGYSHGAPEEGEGEHATTTVLIDPDSYDFSEQQFEASLHPAFAAACGQKSNELQGPELKTASAAVRAGGTESVGPGQEAANPVDESACWREEVTSRIENYRARRKRPPRERSLSLDFERAVNRATVGSESAADSEAEVANQSAVADQSLVSSGQWPEENSSLLEASPETSSACGPLFEDPANDQPLTASDDVFPAHDPRPATDDSKIIEFPRPPLPPVMPPSLEELAEPVLSKPRILEVPEEVETAQAPLGGISLEPEENAPELEIELPLRVASMSQRVFSGLMDTLMVLLATALFLAIVAHAEVPMPHGKAMLMLLAAPALFWAVYQYLFLVHAGATPGMRMAHLTLVTFEGSVVSRRVRRGRALATVLSCLSLGLGLVWALLDEDTLCWHDRISRTYVVSSQ